MPKHLLSRLKNNKLIKLLKLANWLGTQVT